MSSGITLSAGVRQNLLSLQNTASAMATTQNRLATGKKVNSALDNPGSYFTSQSLSNRASDLGNLLDQIGQATSTLQAANQGITSLTTLINSAKSIATQARQSTTPTATYANNIVGNTAIAADTSRSAATNAFSTSGLTASVKSSYTFDASAVFAASADTDTLTLSDGSRSITLQNDSTTAATSGNVGFSSANELKSAVSAFFGSQYSASGNNVTIEANDYGTTQFGTATGTGALTSLVTKTAGFDGSALTITQGSTTSTLRYVTSGASTGAGTFTTLADLKAAINASSVGNSGGPTLASTVLAGDDGANHLTLESLGTSSFTVGGAVATALGVGSSATYNATLDANATTPITGILSVKVGTAAAQTIDFSTVHTKAALTSALAGLTGVTGGIDGSGHVTLSSTTSDAITISGTNNSASALFNGANIGVNSPTVSAGTSSTDRSGLQAQYNALLTQIDQLASDSSYNGINLLNGDTLKVSFNENGTSSLSITGVTLNSAGLGLSNLSGNEFQNNTTIDSVIGNLNSSLSQLRSQASAFGSTLSVVQTRQDFTTNMINTLQTGSDNLVLADTNLEGANLLALQTRQSLSTTALSMANQSNQAVLRLFG